MVRRSYEIEDIDARRREAGIDDVDLRHAIAELGIGDEVKITLLSTAAPLVTETVVLRLTSIRATHFRGTLLTLPHRGTFGDLAVGSSMTFTAAQVHSIGKTRAPKKWGKRPAIT